ncbi:MAG: hypothetical protein FWD96_01740, partial [Defluviitaleaceae bacterium]|nr:hypothetical protein [Defluviitaleaceae bacterium]
YLVKTCLDSRAALVKYIKQHLVTGDFFEMYSTLWDMDTPKELPEPQSIVTLNADELHSTLWNIDMPEALPEPQSIVTLNVDELQESRDFVLSDGRKFVIYR